MPARLKSKKRPSENQKTIGQQKVLKQWQVLIAAIRRRAC
jgi:Holliday junction resolvasome RuvABC ATP-dependent DNA helicase subunit